MHLTQIRRLTYLLFASGVCNIVLLSLLFYWLFKDRPPTPYCDLKPANSRQEQAALAVDQSNGERIRALKEMTREQLVAQLTDSQLVENGYRQRDLSLGCLVAFHYFDLQRALVGQPPLTQARMLTYGNKNENIVVYPELSDEQFQKIFQFARQERWPLTSQGLFLLTKMEAFKEDQTLKDAFYLTPEFLSVALLFSRAEVPVDKGELLAVLREGEFGQLASFTEKQRMAQDLTPARRQRFLLDYISKGSLQAAYLMLKTDGEFALKKLDDRTVIAMLQLMSEKTPAAQKFALELVKSPRSDAVHQLAVNRLYEYSGKPSPKTAPLLPQAPVVVKTAKKSAPPPAPPMQQGRTYVVKEGDSLWKIAKKLKVDIDTLKSYNKLKSDFLKVGSTLKIPQ